MIDRSNFLPIPGDIKPGQANVVGGVGWEKIGNVWRDVASYEESPLWELIKGEWKSVASSVGESVGESEEGIEEGIEKTPIFLLMLIFGIGIYYLVK